MIAVERFASLLELMLKFNSRGTPSIKKAKERRVGHEEKEGKM